MTSWQFLSLFRDHFKISPRSFYFGWYLLEMTLLSFDTNFFTNLEIAVGVFYLINKIFLKKSWSEFESFVLIAEKKAKHFAEFITKTLDVY